MTRFYLGTSGLTTASPSASSTDITDEILETPFDVLFSTDGGATTAVIGQFDATPVTLTGSASVAGGSTIALTVDPTGAVPTPRSYALPTGYEFVAGTLTFSISLIGDADHAAVQYGGPNASYIDADVIEHQPPKKCPPTPDPLVVTVTPVGGTERPLRLEGHPTFSAVRHLGYEQASIPAAREELDAPDLQGAVVRIHGAGWWGVVIEHPEPGRPLSVLGYGAWAGGLIKRAILYSDNRLSQWNQWMPENTYGSDGITPAIKTGSGSGFYLGISSNVPVGKYAMAGISFTDERTFTALDLKWVKTKANTNYGIVIHSGTTPGVIARVEYTNHGTGGTLIRVNFPAGTTWCTVALYNPNGNAFTPTAGGEGIYVTGIRVWGPDLLGVNMPSSALLSVLDDIITDEIPTMYRPTSFSSTLEPGDDLVPLAFDFTTPNEKVAQLCERLPIECGWYGLDSECTIHVWDRPTTPAYVLPLDSIDAPAQLDYARLDEMTSGTHVEYENIDGSPASLYVADTDVTHPLVALGIERHGNVSVQGNATEAALIGADTNAENGRMRVRGTVTVRIGELKTTTGADVDFYGVRPGEMVRVIGTRIGLVDARIHRITWEGDTMSLELDGSAYRLDAMLAGLASRDRDRGYRGGRR